MQARESVGYTPATSFGPGRDDPTLNVEIYASSGDVWEAQGRPPYLVDVEFRAGSIESFAVATLPDLMELLSKWAPAIQAGLASDQARGLFDD